MADGKPGRPRKDLPLGHGHYAGERAERSANRAESRPVSERLPYGTPPPKPDSRWHPKVQSFWKAIGMSDFALVAQPVQWMQAYVCCEVLDRLYTYGFTAGLVKEWHVMSAQLGLAKFGLLDEAAAPEQPADIDEDTAEAAITDIRAKFKVVER